MDDSMRYVGLDVHKERIAVALADGGKRGDVRAFGQIVNTPAALARLLAKLTQRGRSLKFCYEAGPCGYSIQRQLSVAGHDCVVGRITAITGRTTTDSWTYAYDTLDRLIRATNAGNAALSETFSYSTNGNLLSRSRVTGTFTYPAATAARPHALTARWGPATLDKSSPNKAAIRGGEQQQIDANGEQDPGEELGVMQ